MPSAISIKGLSKRFDKLTAVDNINLEIEEGEFFGLLGPNGAGKTTLIRMLVGLCVPSGGSAYIFGKDVVSDMYKARRLIGVAPQEFNFDENLKVREILTFHAGYYNIEPAEQQRRANEILEFLELTDKANTICTKLSGGMKRRLLIGRALMQNPRVLFLDEPTTGVDVQLRRALWEKFSDLKKKGTTIVLTTHYIEEAESLCDRVAIMDHGKFIAMDTPSELKKSSQSHNIIEIIVSAATVPNLKAIKEVIFYTHIDDKLTIRVTNTDVAAVKVLEHLRTAGVPVSSMHVRESSLEDVFIKLTGRELRD